MGGREHAWRQGRARHSSPTSFGLQQSLFEVVKEGLWDARLGLMEKQARKFDSRHVVVLCHRVVLQESTFALERPTKPRSSLDSPHSPIEEL